jgi:hypothetical protein
LKLASLLISLTAVLAVGLLLTQSYLSPTITSHMNSADTSYLRIGNPTVVTLSKLTNSWTVTGPVVTETGIFYYSSFAPACARVTPPCKLPTTIYYYLAVNSTIAYRLILATMPAIANGTRVAVTGTLVTPSPFTPPSGRPLFSGDIYVETITRT